MSPLREAFFEKAVRALSAAHMALERDDAETAMNRAYYAAFYAASAVLAVHGEQP